MTKYRLIKCCSEKRIRYHLIEGFDNYIYIKYLADEVLTTAPMIELLLFDGAIDGANVLYDEGLIEVDLTYVTM